MAPPRLWISIPVMLSIYSTIATAATAVEPPSLMRTTLMMMANVEPAILTKNSDEPLVMMVNNWRKEMRPLVNMSGTSFFTNGMSDHTAPTVMERQLANAAACNPNPSTTIRSTSRRMFNREHTMLMVMLNFTLPHTRK